MNTAQRRLILAALTVLAVGLHVWHYDYEVSDTPDPSLDRSSTAVQWLKPPPGTALVWWTYKGDCEVEFVDKDGKPGWVQQGGGQYYRVVSARRQTGADDGLWMTLPRVWRLQVKPFDEPDGALLLGVIAPLAAIGVGVFLILGWRKPKTPGDADPAA